MLKPFAISICTTKNESTAVNKRMLLQILSIQLTATK